MMYIYIYTLLVQIQLVFWTNIHVQNIWETRSSCLVYNIGHCYITHTNDRKVWLWIYTKSKTHLWFSLYDFLFVSSSLQHKHTALWWCQYYIPESPIEPETKWYPIYIINQQIENNYDFVVASGKGSESINPDYLLHLPWIVWLGLLTERSKDITRNLSTEYNSRTLISIISSQNYRD